MCGSTTLTKTTAAAMPDATLIKKPRDQSVLLIGNTTTHAHPTPLGATIKHLRSYNKQASQTRPRTSCIMTIRFGTKARAPPHPTASAVSTNASGPDKGPQQPQTLPPRTQLNRDLARFEAAKPLAHHTNEPTCIGAMPHVLWLTHPSLQHACTRCTFDHSNIARGTYSFGPQINTHRHNWIHSCAGTAGMINYSFWGN